MLNRALLLALATAHAWNDCAFPDVGYFALDEGVGISHNYASAAMNGKVYMGGYTKGNFALVGVTDGPDVNPVPAAALWGDTTSDVVSIYLAEVSTTGQMTKAWRFQGSALQIGTVSISNTNGVYAGGVRAMLNKQHLAVLAHYRQQFTLPDGTQWSAALHTDNSARLNTADKTPFLMKLDVSSTNGVGTGTTGWARVMDEDHLGVTIHPGGVSIHSVDGDTNGDMIVSYTGYSGYNASTEEMTGGVSYVTKLLAADGSEVWKKVVPKKLANCRAINDGSFFCGYSMSSSDTAVDFGNGKIVSAAAADMGSRDKKAVVVKFDGLGVAQWAKDSSSHNVGFSKMAASVDGTVLVLTAGGVTSRMDTTPGSEGAIVWTDRNPGAGGHSGFRGLEVTGDGGEVVVHGSVSGSAVTLVDSANSEIELRTRGSYEVFVAAFDGTTGKGKWAIDGGGTGMEYMFSMAVDPDTRDVYVGGTSRSEYITWGDVKRKNVMVNGYSDGSLGSQGLSPVGSSKAFTVQIKSTTSLPSCLTTCSASAGLGVQASDVKAGHCFIGGKCVAEGTHGKVQTGMGRWGPTYGPDPCTKCIPSVSGAAYSPVAENGCMLDMATFTAACYDDQGNMTMTETDKVQLMADKASMTTTVATRDATITTHANTIKDLDTSNIQMAADLKTAKADND